MSAAPIDAAQSTAPTSGSGAQGVSATAAAAARKGHGPLVGFEALLAILNAAQDGPAGPAARETSAPGAKPGASTKQDASATAVDDLAPGEAKADTSDAGEAVNGAVNPALVVALPQAALAAPTIEPPVTTGGPGASGSAVVIGQADPASVAARLAEAAAKSAPMPVPANSTQDVEPKATVPNPSTPVGFEVAVAPLTDQSPSVKADLTETAKSPIPPAAAAPSTAPATPPATPGTPAQTQQADSSSSTATAIAPAAALEAAAGAQASEQAGPSVTPSSTPGTRDRTSISKTPRVDGVRTGAASTGGAAISTKMAEAVQSQAETDLTAAGPAPDSSGASLLDAETATPSDTGTSLAENTASSQATATPTTPIHTEPAQVRALPQTVATLAAQIVKKLDGRSSHFDVALDPVGLGHVNVRVVIGASGKMSAALAFDTPQAAAELRGRAGELHAALEKAGFDLSGGLTFDVAGDRGQGQGATGQDGRTAAGFRGQAFQTALDTVSDLSANSSLAFTRSPTSGVDIRI